ncbi:unnamed protein product [Meloidogyne enterolobii]|uniref:Uncharacterized protein n=1 Tax=Meloidogyne enterolobii TaxID=390850 RepID=A0ACB0YFD7_MELEN
MGVVLNEINKYILECLFAPPSFPPFPSLLPPGRSPLSLSLLPRLSALCRRRQSVAINHHQNQWTEEIDPIPSKKRG